MRITLPDLKVTNQGEGAGVLAVAKELLIAAQDAMEGLKSREARDGVLACEVEEWAPSMPKEWSGDDREMLNGIVTEVVRENIKPTWCIPIQGMILTLHLDSSRRGSEWISWTELARVRIGDGATYIRKSRDIRAVTEFVKSIQPLAIAGTVTDRRPHLLLEVYNLLAVRKQSIAKMEEIAAVKAAGMIVARESRKAVVPVGDALFQLRLANDDGISIEWESLGSKVSEATVAVVYDSERFRKKVDEELRDLPQGFEERRAALRAMHEVSRSAIAAAFEDALNRQAQAMPHATYEEKKGVANWINEEARNLGIALRCPRTGAAALLRAQPGGPNGRFAVEVTDERGRRHHTSTTAQLPRVELRPDDLSRAPWGGRTSRGK